MRAALVTVVAGGLYGLAFPPLAAWWVAWIALAPLIVVARTRGARAAALCGALYAAVGTCVTVHWLPHTIAVYYQQPVALGLALFAGVTLLMVVPPVAAFAATVSATATAPAAVRVLLAAAAWTAGELWRAHAFGGNPWVLVGYSQAHVGLVAQLADLAGPYGIGFVVVAANAALAEAALALAGRTGARDVVAAAGLAAVLLAVTLGYGQRAGRGTDAGAATPVLVVQGDLDLGAQWRQELYGENLEHYLRLTMEAARRRRPKLVVWPEAAFTFFLETEPMYEASLASVLRPFDLELVAGGPHAVPGVANAYTNAAFAIEPTGAIRGRYDKERLLPFAEYYPLGALTAVRRPFGGVRTFVPGQTSPPLPTAAGKAGILICNEAMFPELARARVRDGAELLLVLTNDTWVGSPTFAGIAFDMAVLRAIETRRWTIRASTAGPSAIIDPAGAVHEVVAYDKTATVAGDVAARSGLTVYARWGDVFAIACAAATFLAVMAAVRRRARGRGAA